MNDKILDRVKKMLALANDAGATEGERDTAMRMAYNLLAKHNLTMADLPSDQSSEPREEHTTTISADKWARSLAQAVGKLFFCKYFFGRTGVSGKDVHYFVGRQSNAVTALHMTEYLIKSVKREASRRYGSATSPEGRSFCVGTVSTIRSRVEDLIRTAPEGAPGSALVLVNLHKQEEDANSAWLDARGTRIVRGTSRADNSLRGAAFHDGRAYGHSVSLHNQVGGAVKGFKQLR